MKEYYIEVPVVLKLMVGVSAENEEDAIEKVFDSNIEIEVKDEGEKLEWIDYEWEMHKKVVQGNVYYGGINEIRVEESE